MTASYGAEAALNALSLNQYPNVYFIGPYAERASFASQQRRALNLIWALHKDGSIAASRIGIIGAGLAGVTAAAAAIASGAAVWLFERHDYISAMQRETDKRYIHPTINFWPDEPLKSTTDWSFLNWYAAPCRVVISTIERQWNAHFRRSVQAVKAVVKQIVPNGTRVDVLYGDNEKREFDIVIVAVGYGKEKELPGIPANSYWLDLEHDRAEITANRQVWISGVGDGGLIDCLRLCYDKFNLGRLLAETAYKLNHLSATIKAIEGHARLGSADQACVYLQDQYLGLAERPDVQKSLLSALAKADHSLATVVHRASTPFDPRTAPIHRLLFAFALTTGKVQPVRGELESRNGRPFLLGEPAEINSAALLLRHGASGALTELVSPEAINILEGKEHRRHQDALKSRLWEEGFFEGLPASEFPTPTRKRAALIHEIIGILSAAVAQHDQVANISVTPGAQPEIRVRILDSLDSAFQFMPEKICGISIKTEFETEISSFRGGANGTASLPNGAIAPGSVLAFPDAGTESHVLTCFVNDLLTGSILALCVTHGATPPLGSTVWSARRVQIGKVCRVISLDGSYNEVSDGPISCVLFNVHPGVEFRVAPEGRQLVGTVADPVFLVERERPLEVNKWAPSGFAAGRVSAVAGIARIRTVRGHVVFEDLIFVEGVEGQGFAVPGDSGSLVVATDHTALGVVLAGDSQYTQLIPLATILARCQLRLLPSATTDAQPDSAASLEFARMLLDQGKLIEAERLFREVLAIRFRVFGPNHLEVAAVLHGLGAVSSRKGNFGEAEHFLRDALRIREGALGLHSPQVAGTLQTLGWLCGDRGNFLEAEAMFRQALHIREQVGGPQHFETGEALRALGWSLRRQRRLSDAEPFLRRALEIAQEDKHRGQSGETNSLLELGWLLVDQGKPKEAEPLFRRVLEVRERVSGANDLTTAAAMQGLGIVLRYLARFTEAESCLQKALEIRRRLLGSNNSLVASTLQAIGWLHGDRRNLEQAEHMFLEALRIRERVSGLDHPETAQALRAVGWVLRRQHRHREAEQVLRRAIAISQAASTGKNGSESAVLLELAWLLSDQGRLQEAQLAFQDVLDKHHRLSASEEVDTSAAMQGLGSVLRRLGNLPEAQRLLRRALEIRERLFGSEHPLVASTLQELGWVESDEGNLAESEALFRRVLQIRERFTAQDELEVARSLQGLGSVLRRLQRYSEAETVLQRASEIQKREKSST